MTLWQEEGSRRRGRLSPGTAAPSLRVPLRDQTASGAACSVYMAPCTHTAGNTQKVVCDPGHVRETARETAQMLDYLRGFRVEFEPCASLKPSVV